MAGAGCDLFISLSFGSIVLWASGFGVGVGVGVGFGFGFGFPGLASRGWVFAGFAGLFVLFCPVLFGWFLGVLWFFTLRLLDVGWGRVEE